MIIKFCENAFLRIRDKKAVYEQRLLSGCFESLEEYKGVAGKLQGLSEAEDIVKKLYKDMFDYKPEKKGEGYDEV